MKKYFLESLFNLLSDELPRYFVPEVNSGNQDVASIVNDMISVGLKFQNWEK